MVVSTTAIPLALATSLGLHCPSYTYKCTVKGAHETSQPSGQKIRSLWSMESALARKNHVLRSLTMQPAAFDNSPCPCRHSPPVHHTTGRSVSDTIQEDHRWSGSASTALLQTMRTSNHNKGVDLGIWMNTWQVLQQSALEGAMHNGTIKDGGMEWWGLWREGSKGLCEI